MYMVRDAVAKRGARMLLELLGKLDIKELHALSPRALKDLGVPRLIVSEYGFAEVPVAVIIPYNEYAEFQRVYLELQKQIDKLSVSFRDLLVLGAPEGKP
jgi:hypothetical protein